MKSFDPTSASRAVLIEVMNILGAFRDEIVLVGGWVPDLLYAQALFDATDRGDRTGGEDDEAR